MHMCHLWTSISKQTIIFQHFPRNTPYQSVSQLKREMQMRDVDASTLSENSHSLDFNNRNATVARKTTAYITLYTVIK